MSRILRKFTWWRPRNPGCGLGNAGNVNRQEHNNLGRGGTGLCISALFSAHAHVFHTFPCPHRVSALFSAPGRLLCGSRTGPARGSIRPPRSGPKRGSKQPTTRPCLFFLFVLLLFPHPFRWVESSSHAPRHAAQVARALFCASVLFSWGGNAMQSQRAKSASRENGRTRGARGARTRPIPLLRQRFSFLFLEWVYICVPRASCLGRGRGGGARPSPRARRVKVRFPV